MKNRLLAWLLCLAMLLTIGAVAVAEGAGDPLVRIELEQALCALLGLPASAVSVVTGGE